MFVLYALLRNRQYAYDAIDFATAARDGVNLWHPHHLAYNWSAHQLHVALSSVDTIVLLAIANSMITSATAVILAVFVTMLSGDRRLGLLHALIFAFSYGGWYMATSVECYPLTSLCEIVALFVVARRPTPSNVDVATAVALTFLAALFHQTAVFFSFGAAYLLWKRRGNIVPAIVYLVISGALVLGAYVAVARTTAAIADTKSFIHWLFSYAHSAQFASGQWGGGLKPLGPVLGLVGAVSCLWRPGFTDTIHAFSPYKLHWADPVVLVLLLVAVALFVSLCVVHRRSHQPRTDASTSSLRTSLWIWVGCHALFTIWWEGVNYEFWVLLLPPLLLLLSMWLQDSRDSRRFTIAVVLFCLSNFIGSAVPAAVRPNPILATVDSVRAAGADSSTLVLSNVPDLDPYSRYFYATPLRVVTVCFAGEPETTRLIGESKKTLVLETETLEVHGLCSQQSLAAFYAKLATRWKRVGTYPMYERTWNLYAL